MSGFCGELSLSDERPGAHLDAMDAAMRCWGSDHAARFQEGPVALASRVLRVSSVRGGGATIGRLAQPLVESDLVVAGPVRLDDRMALGCALNLGPQDLSRITDLQLVARAWRLWGPGCVQHLSGDWVCAIYDRQRRSLWIGRDACGNTCLYYWHGRKRLVFSTSLKAVLAHPAVPRSPDAYWIARRLTSMPDREQLGDTAYENVSQLPGGFALRQRGDGVDRVEWWRPESLAEFDSASESTDDDYVRAFRQLYELAVRGQRLRAFTSVPWLSPEDTRAGTGIQVDGIADFQS